MTEPGCGFFVLKSMNLWIAVWMVAGALAMLVPGQSRREGSLKVGDRAPDFTLKQLNSDKTFTLSSNFGKRPTVLIFGSYT
jgi:hypothetical protein